MAKKAMVKTPKMLMTGSTIRKRREFRFLSTIHGRVFCCFSSVFGAYTGRTGASGRVRCSLRRISPAGRHGEAVLSSAIACPQPAQNLAESSFLWPHFEQYILSLPFCEIGAAVSLRGAAVLIANMQISNKSLIPCFPNSSNHHRLHSQRNSGFLPKIISRNFHIFLLSRIESQPQLPMLK